MIGVEGLIFVTFEQLQTEIGGHQCLRTLDVGDNRIQV